MPVARHAWRSCQPEEGGGVHKRLCHPFKNLLRLDSNGHRVGNPSDAFAKNSFLDVEPDKRLIKISKDIDDG